MKLRAVLLGLLLGATSPAEAHPCKLRPFVVNRPPSAVPYSVAGDVAELEAVGGFRKSNRVPPEQRTRHGVAEALIDAPPERVLAEVVDFARYKELAPKKFKASEPVAVSPSGETDVYMQVTVLRGLLAIWQIMRFSAPDIQASGARVVEGRYVRGNLQDAHGRFVIERADANRSVLRFELYIGLPVPAPEDAVDEELRDAAGDFVRGLQRRLAPATP